MIHAKEIQLVPLKDIKLNPKNRNKHPKEQIDRLVEIMKYQGFRRPGTISNQTGLLVCGEGRYLAAKAMGLKSMPVMYQDYESEEQEYADGIADNAIDKWADLDLAGINLDITDLGPELNLEMLGLANFVLEPTEKGTRNTGTELDLESFDNFQHECPKCGFEWNDNGST